MKRISLMLCSVALFLFACNNEKKADSDKTVSPSSENTTDTSLSKPTAPMDSAAMAKAWTDFSTPGDMHKWMAKSAGTWSCDSVAQWMDPAAPPSFSKASSTEKIILNGLYIEGDYSSNMMGMPMGGKSIMGFDNVKKKFVMSWIDNLGSGIVRMEGDYDAATKTLNLKGKQSDPSVGGESDIRQEQKWIDDNTFVLSMYGTGHDGKSEQKFMEGTFKRKK
jgi:Protein of unknown function (DUF1579)